MAYTTNGINTNRMNGTNPHLDPSLFGKDKKASLISVNCI
jgi:hypothetical protein